MSVFVASGLRVAQEVGFARTAQRITCLCEVGGHQVAPDASPTYAVFSPGVVEDDAPIASGTGTVSGNTITASLDLTDESDFPLQRGYRAKFTWTNSTLTYTTQVVFHVVRNPVQRTIPCNEYELIASHVRVEEALNQVGRLGFSGNFYIVEAFNEVTRWLTSTGRHTAEVMPRDDLNALVLPLARAKLYESMIVSGGDTWDTMSTKARAEYENAKRTMPLHVARGDSNNGDLDRTGSIPSMSAAPDGVLLSISGGRRARW